MNPNARELSLKPAFFLSQFTTPNHSCKTSKFFLKYLPAQSIAGTTRFLHLSRYGQRFKLIKRSEIQLKVKLILGSNTQAGSNSPSWWDQEWDTSKKSGRRSLCKRRVVSMVFDIYILDFTFYILCRVWYPFSRKYYMYPEFTSCAPTL